MNIDPIYRDSELKKLKYLKWRGGEGEHDFSFDNT